MRWSWNYTTIEESEALYQKAWAQAKLYDLIIYIPVMFDNVVDDGFRWANAVYQEQMDRLIKATLFDMGLMEKVYILKSPSVEDRVREVVGVLLVLLVLLGPRPSGPGPLGPRPSGPGTLGPSP
jgi:hypothetical protein